MSSQAGQTENERRAEAVDILRQLALGNDPQSGMSLEPTHVVNRLVNIRALLLGLETLQPKATAAPNCKARRARNGSARASPGSPRPSGKP